MTEQFSFPLHIGSKCLNLNSIKNDLEEFVNLFSPAALPATTDAVLDFTNIIFNDPYNGTLVIPKENKTVVVDFKGITLVESEFYLSLSYTAGERDWNDTRGFFHGCKFYVEGWAEMDKENQRKIHSITFTKLGVRSVHDTLHDIVVL